MWVNFKLFDVFLEIFYDFRERIQNLLNLNIQTIGADSTL